MAPSKKYHLTTSLTFFFTFIFSLVLLSQLLLPISPPGTLKNTDELYRLGSFIESNRASFLACYTFLCLYLTKKSLVISIFISLISILIFFTKTYALIGLNPILLLLA